MFKNIFRKKLVCVGKVSVTDSFVIADSKTLAKLEVGEMLEALGDSKKDEATGMERLQCKVLSTGEEGFVSVKGNQGTTYLEPAQPFTQFCQEIDQKIKDMQSTTADILKSVKAKRLDPSLLKSTDGPLRKARDDMAEIVNVVSSERLKIETLKKNVEKSRVSLVQHLAV